MCVRRKTTAAGMCLKVAPRSIVNGYVDHSFQPAMQRGHRVKQNTAFALRRLPQGARGSRQCYHEQRFQFDRSRKAHEAWGIRPPTASSAARTQAANLWRAQAMASMSRLVRRNIGPRGARRDAWEANTSKLRTPHPEHRWRCRRNSGQSVVQLEAPRSRHTHSRCSEAARGLGTPLG